MTDLPANAVCYKKTAPFTPETLPAKFANRHHTKAGVWGQIHMLSGQLELTLYDGDRAYVARRLGAGDTAVFGPQEPHAVGFPDGEGAFEVWFHRLPGDISKDAPHEEHPVLGQD